MNDSNLQANKVFTKSENETLRTVVIAWQAGSREQFRCHVTNSQRFMGYM